MEEFLIRMKWAFSRLTIKIKYSHFETVFFGGGGGGELSKREVSKAP